MKDNASKGANVQTGLSEVAKIGPVGPEMDTTGKDQKPTKNPTGKVKAPDRPGSFNWK